MNIQLQVPLPPYLLEFATLKFSLDKFSNVIGGYPVEIETDCMILSSRIN
jgi:hypothetical protein